MTTMYGADADGLDRVAAQISTAAEELQAEMNALTANLRAIEWLGPIATSFTDEWMGTGLAQIRSTTGFLKAASTDLQQQATAQREASKGGGGGSWPADPALAGGGGGSWPHDADIPKSLEANRAALRQYLQRLHPNSPLRKAIEKNLAAGAEVYYFDPQRGYIAWATPNISTAKNVVMTIPGTDNSLESVTNDFLGQAEGYQRADPNVAVMSTYTWEPPPSVEENIRYHKFGSLSHGPMPEIIRSLSSEGKAVVPTAHSAAANAFGVMMRDNPDLAGNIRGVALLAPSELDPHLIQQMRGKYIFVAVHQDDPMGVKMSVWKPWDAWAFQRARNVQYVGSVPSGRPSDLPGGLAPIAREAHGQHYYIRNFSRRIVNLFDQSPPPPPPPPKIVVPPYGGRNYEPHQPKVP